MIEIWKDVVGYEGLYQVSNFGRIKGLDRICWNGCANHIHKGIIHRGGISCGYHTVTLRKNLKTKTYKVSRLVTEAFIPNLECKPCVNHKDGNKLNDNIENLEWCTYAENNLHAYKIGLKIGSKAWLGHFGKKHHSSKKIGQYDLQGNLVKIRYGANEIKRDLGYCNSTIGLHCISLKKFKNSIWMYI